MSCGCGPFIDGKAIVDHVKKQGKAHFEPNVLHNIACGCGETFILEKVIMNCPKCEMTYAVTPCTSSDINNIRQAGVKYA
ncbi:MAG: hypothetical protein AB2401_04455, partial [Bacillus sp. (in: firmicutes)]|uniref:hypothetical protein n=1 Tax=Bacillus marasmi TaxID=1926279 RepID=UPI0011CCDCEF|nr:hypothetical protein [Bacillus marasmi]